MNVRATALAALILAATSAWAMEQEETYTDLAPGSGMLDPANLSQLVRQGDVRAMNNVGLLWAKGFDGKQSYEEAMRWWKEAARRGYTVAMNNIGLAYANGHGVAANMDEAFNWWHQAAFLGNAWSMNAVGDCYENGSGAAQNYAMAMTWYRSAAEYGDAMAMYNVGALFESGKGVDKDDVQALTWYRKGAESGDASAMRAVGRFYRDGRGVTSDLVEAYAWHSIAGKRFSPREQDETALNQRETDELASMLSPADRERATERIAELDVLTRPAEPEPKQPVKEGESRI